MNVNYVDIPSQAPSHKITIIPIELHYSLRARSNGFSMQTWKKLIPRIEKDPNCYVIFPGDIIDSDRPSMRARKAHVYAETERIAALEDDDLDHQRGLREGLIKDLARIKHKIIGMVDGDHFRQYANGTTSTWYMANQLGIPNVYLGERMGWIRLRFKYFKDACNFDILARHGKGGAGAFGNDVNALIRQSAGWDASLYIGAHTHKQWFIKIPHLYCGRNEIKQRPVGYARAGSLLRGFLYGQTTYPELCEYNPLSIGCPEIYVYVKRSSSFNNGNLFVSDIKGLT